MNCLEINNGLKNIYLGEEAIYIGCYLANDVRRIFKKLNKEPVVFILNTLDEKSPATMMGHWMTVYVHNKPSGAIIALLDSFGLKMEFHSRYLQEFLSYFEDYRVYMFTQRIQSMDSYYCGAYAMFFVYQLCNFNLRAALHKFETLFEYGEYDMNDRKIIQFAYSNFAMPNCKKTFCIDGQDKCLSLCNDSSYY